MKLKKKKLTYFCKFELSPFVELLPYANFCIKNFIVARSFKHGQLVEDDE